MMDGFALSSRAISLLCTIRLLRLAALKGESVSIGHAVAKGKRNTRVVLFP